MQVSWIDPDEIRALLGQIEGPLPRPASNNFAWELNTLPVMPMNPLPADNMIEGPGLQQASAAAPVQPSPPPVPPEFPLSDSRSGPATGDLWRIRERLRSLREQAQESGILPRTEEAAPAADVAPEPLAPVLTPAPARIPQPAFDSEPPTAFPTGVVDELIAEFTAAVQAFPEAEPAANFDPGGYHDQHAFSGSSRNPLPEAFSPWEEEADEAPARPVAEPSAVPYPAVEPPQMEQSTVPPAIPPMPSAAFAPVDLPVPTPPPLPLGPVTLEYAGPAPGSPDYEPLFSHTAPVAAQVPFTYVPPAAVAQPPAPAASMESPFSLAETTPAPVVAPVEPDKPPFVVPHLGLSDRLSALAHWASQRLATSEVLLVDDYGDVLWGGHAQTPLVLSAMMAWHAAQRSTAETACHEPHRIDKDLASGRSLTVLPARTRYGVVSLAAIQDHPMSEADELDIRAALILAVEGPDIA